MTWIKSVPPAEAGPALARTYEQAAAFSKRGKVSNLWTALGGDADALASLHAHFRSVMGNPAPLSPAQAEMLAVVVSATNGCGYSVTHHGQRLAALAGEPLAHAVALDYREANLAARDRVLLDAAVALTCEPAERTNADIERLREYGFDDAAILKLTSIAAFFNLINRLASGLGVALEDGMKAWEFGAQK